MLTVESIAKWHESRRIYYEKMAQERLAAGQSYASAAIAADVHKTSHRHIIEQLEAVGGEAVSAPRLDPVTLRAVIAELESDLESEGLLPSGFSAAEVLRTEIDELNRWLALATEAEAREPDMGDWMRTLIDSRLGNPTFRYKHRPSDNEEVFAAVWDGVDAVALIWPDSIELWIGRWWLGDWRGSSADLTTLADLRSALNALADVKP
jgi:hypothetical protein